MKQRSSDNRVPKPFGKRCANILALTREPHAIQMMQDRDAFSSAKMQVWTPKMQGPEQCSVTQQGARVLIHKRNPRHHRHRYKRARSLEQCYCYVQTNHSSLCYSSVPAGRYTSAPRPTETFNGLINASLMHMHEYNMYPVRMGKPTYTQAALRSITPAGVTCSNKCA